VTGEFAAIAAIRSRLPGPTTPGEVWIGDDAAVLPVPTNGRLLLASDSVVAGVHADLGLTGLDDLGWKAMAACISDIAAMGGEPDYAVVAVAGPAGTDLGLLYEGIAAASTEYRCPVVGGDLANAPRLVVTVTVTGSSRGEPVLRSGAHPGDLIWVTGLLGAAAAGLRLYRDGRRGPDPLLAAHARPRAEIAAGRAARTCGATAMIDVSDGLAADLGHVAEASGVGLRLDAVPVAPGATRSEALSGGEDYALVFCAPPSAPVAACFAGLGQPILLGRCTADPGERTIAGEPFPASGWEHRW